MRRSTSPLARDDLDPGVIHARREAGAILIAFGACLIWSVGCCYLLGYHEPADGKLATVLGMPSWVFWGVAVPWLAADVFAFWFCFHFAADDPLGESEDEASAHDGAGDFHQPGGEDRHA